MEEEKTWGLSLRTKLPLVRGEPHTPSSTNTCRGRSLFSCSTEQGKLMMNEWWVFSPDFPTDSQ